MYYGFSMADIAAICIVIMCALIGYVAYEAGVRKGFNEGIEYGMRKGARNERMAQRATYLARR